jgi:hypothetical protein
VYWIILVKLSINPLHTAMKQTHDHKTVTLDSVSIDTQCAAAGSGRSENTLYI